MKTVLICIVVCFVLFMLWDATTDAEETHLPFSNDNAIRAIVGECSGEGKNGFEKYTAMSYVAHAIRNRGSLKGVYGLNASHANHEPEWVWRMAREAWERSETEGDPTRGSDSWGSIEDVTKPGWTDRKEFRVQYLGHYFYEEQ